jgi:hypothetical protein
MTDAAAARFGIAITNGTASAIGAAYTRRLKVPDRENSTEHGKNAGTEHSVENQTWIK